MIECCVAALGGDAAARVTAPHVGVMRVTPTPCHEPNGSLRLVVVRKGTTDTKEAAER